MLVYCLSGGYEYKSSVLLGVYSSLEQLQLAFEARDQADDYSAYFMVARQLDGQMRDDYEEDVEVIRL